MSKYKPGDIVILTAVTSSWSAMDFILSDNFDNPAPTAEYEGPKDYCILTGEHGRLLSRCEKSDSGDGWYVQFGDRRVCMNEGYFKKVRDGTFEPAWHAHRKLQL